MRFDTIVVPRGAEARAVAKGWPAARGRMVRVSAGAAAARGLPIGRPGQAALVFGVCGALDPSLRVGDTVVYARVIDGTETFELDPDLAAHCAGVYGVAPVSAANVERVIGEVAAKAELRAATGASAIDMEAGALARSLHRDGVRVAMVRVVSDDARGALPDLANAYSPDGTLRPGELAFALLRAPVRGARFIAAALRALRALQRAAPRMATTVEE